MAIRVIRKLSNLLICAYLALFAASVSAQTKPLAIERIETVGDKQVKLTSKLTKVKKVLVPQFYYGYNHSDGRTEIQRLLTLIGTEDGITFEFFNLGQEAQFTVEKMKTTNAAVILANNITSINSDNNKMTAAQKSAVQNFVEVQGGGFLVIHGTGDSKGAGHWEWLNTKAHPAGYLNHGTIGQTTRVWQPTSNSNLAPLAETAKGHPINEGIPRGYTVIREEFHNFTNVIDDVVPAAQILLHVDDNYAGFNCACTKRPTRGHPISWTFPLLKGTVVYHAFGHDDVLATDTWGPNQTRTTNNWKTFLRQAVYFAAGYDTTEISTRIHGNGSGYHFGDGGIAFNERTMSLVFTEQAPHSVQVLDVRGKIVANEKGLGSKEYIFDRSRFQHGIYYMRAATGKVVQTRKYLVERNH